MQVLCTLRWKAICDALLRWHLDRLLLHWCRLQSEREYTPALVFYFGKWVWCRWSVSFSREKNHPASSDSELFSSDCLYIPAVCSLTGSAKFFFIWFSCDGCGTWASTRSAHGPTSLFSQSPPSIYFKTRWFKLIRVDTESFWQEMQNSSNFGKSFSRWALLQAVRKCLFYCQKSV